VISAQEGRPGLRQLIEHLGGPDDWHVSGLAQPQDLLLHLREALVAAFHGEIAAGDHDSGGPLSSERRQEHPGQMLKREARLDLEDRRPLGVSAGPGIR
jgi:hypothetical protein